MNEKKLMGYENKKNQVEKQVQVSRKKYLVEKR